LEAAHRRAGIGQDNDGIGHAALQRILVSFDMISRGRAAASQI